jgi:hypothetical protein
MIMVNDMLIEIIDTSLSEEQIWNDDATLENGISYKNNEEKTTSFYHY